MLRLLVLVCVFSATGAFGQSNPGIGVGAFPLSSTTVSMWLLGGSATGNPQPIVLVYFNGPAGWHQRPWESKFEGNIRKEERATYQLVSSTVTLEIVVSADRKSVLVQGQEFQL